MKNLFLISAVVLFSFFVAAQEAITVMQYNLTYYGSTDADPVYDCNTTTNNMSSKDGYLNTIIDEVAPDVFCVNELMIKYQGGDNILADRILTNVMGTDYARGEHTGSSNICNMIYYNTTKLGLHKQDFIFKDLNGDNIIREIDFYTLYFKDADLATHQDTIYMTFVVAHLKAGETEDALREKEVEAAMDYINNHDLGPNLFFMGDLNVYSHLDETFQTLTNYSNSSINFYDPVNQIGEWHNGSAYRMHHTQSTRSSDDNGGCFVSGGLDDRFDFILINKKVRDNLYGVQYKSGSYKAFGQDGSATNNGTPLNTFDNSVVSSTVANALYEMSDHLPVVLELEVKQGPLGLEEHDIISSVNMNNPFANELNLTVAAREYLKKVKIEVYDITGKIVLTSSLKVHNTRFFTSINTTKLPQGIYLLTLSDANTNQTMATEKIIKQ